MEPGCDLARDETGSVVGPRTDSSSGVCLDKIKRTSKGPKASKTWKPSKSAIAYLVGGFMVAELTMVEV